MPEDFKWNPGNGGLHQNPKTKQDQPDFRGSATLPDGKVVEVAGWWRKNKQNEDWLSLKFQEPRQEKDAPVAEPTDPKAPLF